VVWKTEVLDTEQKYSIGLGQAYPNCPNTKIIMPNSDSSIFSRRQWLASASTVAASAGAGLWAASTRADEPVKIVSSGSPGTRIYDIRDFGAKGDGKTLDTAALQAAIDACHNDQGGTVLVPAGVFAIGTTELKSDVTLHITAQGTLLGTGDGKQYFPADAIPLEGDSTLEDGHVGLLFAVNAENITVEGPGMIDGQGALFRSAVRGGPTPSGISGPHRPYHLLFYRCNNLRVRDIYLKDSAFHSTRIIQSTYVYLDGIHIKGRVVHNNDGFHFISSQYVHLTNCDVQSQDDACALFGSCKFVTITNCSFSTRWSVFRFGGGVAENITVSNCIINEVWGCPIKLRCGPGSRFENISFSNLVMNNVTGPISIGLGARHRRGPAGAMANTQTNLPSASETNTEEDSSVPPGIVRNISFSNIRATIAKPLPLTDSEVVSGYNPGEVFSGITLNAYDEGFLENINFDNVHVTFPGGGTAEQAAVRDVPKVAGEYYTMGVPPSYALFARNVRGLTLQNVRFEISASDLRPAMVFDHVSDAAVNGFSVQGDPGAESVLRFIESKDVLLSAARLLKPAPIFLQVEGPTNEGITLDGGDLSKAAAPVAFKNGAVDNSVKVRS
jgi:polygalacturonase